MRTAIAVVIAQIRIREFLGFDSRLILINKAREITANRVKGISVQTNQELKAIIGETAIKAADNLPARGDLAFLPKCIIAAGNSAKEPVTIIRAATIGLKTNDNSAIIIGNRGGHKTNGFSPSPGKGPNSLWMKNPLPLNKDSAAPRYLVESGEIPGFAEPPIHINNATPPKIIAHIKSA